MKTIPRKVIYLAAALMLAASLALLHINAPQSAATTPHTDLSTSARNDAALTPNQRTSIEVPEVDLREISHKD
jgi:hypothetical protein